MLFQGEEWGAKTPFLYFTDHDDPELGKAVTEGRRREFAAFGWDPTEVPDPQDPETFRRSKLDWHELDRPEHADLLDWHRRLIALRRATPGLTDGSLPVEVAYDEAARWLVYSHGGVTVAANLGEGEVAVPVPAGRTVALSSSDRSTVDADGTARLAPQSVVVVATP
jgi:maltooligosyltrehalose trehalohydrolase